MSFCVNAAPFNETENISTIEKKRIQKNKTIKRTQNKKDGSKDNIISELMAKIHNTSDKNEDSDSEDDDFQQLLPPPEITQSKKIQSKLQNPSPPPPSLSSNQSFDNSKIMDFYPQDLEQNKNSSYPSSASSSDDLYTPSENDKPVTTKEQYQNLPNLENSQYYKRLVPYYNNMSSNGTQSNENLLEKINYIIQLLEDQQDEKTGHVTEELILYTFLGVFIIFIVDSFARAGKYTR